MPPVFRQGHDQSRHQDPTRRHLVRSDLGPEPRTSSVGSILDLAAERRACGPCYGSRQAPRTLSPEPCDSASSKETSRRFVLPRAPSVCLAAPLVELGEDAPHRLLQSTYDTSTRQSLGYRARSFRRIDPAGTSQLAVTVDTRPPVRRAVLLRGVRPPCGNPTPVGLRLTAQVQLRLLAARCYRLAALSSVETSGRPFG
jgi:hypothetical protein